MLTIAIPCFKAQTTICSLLSSIAIQSYQDIKIILANDNPEDNDDYDFVKSRFPQFDITILTCEKNTGPGLARQRGLDACKTEWITFMDADDILFNPFSLETLVNNITPNAVQVMGAFLQEIKEGNLTYSEKTQIFQSGGQIPPRFMPRSDVQHPWVFGRMYNVPFLRSSGIEFSELRAIK